MSTKPDLSDLWTRHQRNAAKTTKSFACQYCPERRIHASEDDLWNHALLKHKDKIPLHEDDKQKFKKEYIEISAQKTPLPIKNDPLPRDNSFTEPSSGQLEPPPPGNTNTKRPFSPIPSPPTRSLSGLQGLNIGTPREPEDVTMHDASEEDNAEAPRKRAAIGDGISAAGSASPYRESESPPPRRSKARPTSAPYGSASDPEVLQEPFDTQRPHVPKKQLWSPDHDNTFAKGPFDRSNIASVHAQKSRAPGLQSKPPRRINHSSPQAYSMSSRPAPALNTPNPNSIISRANVSPSSQTFSKDDGYDIILQPETRPISQEQLVAEVKGIYAGLVMVEAKCIEVDNKQATLSQGDNSHAKLNNEQWQALIALHRTLLHEHHDFFLASQHPSASPALRRLASKYAMPARMWRHGIHSFLELLRHRLPASLDHMLAFIYLAYTMMALLYETVPAFEDTWIECLGDLGRYRMAIEDDDIRDREVWTGVARHWYSKASDKAPTTGRLYHHLAILARPNALQQLFYYSKSLCVVIPFVSARESILTLFEPVLNADNGQGHYRLPPLDTTFVRAHGLLFTGRTPEKFEPAMQAFLGLLDNQIGRVTRKFMEQGYYIAVANIVAMLGFASKENIVMQAIEASKAQESDPLNTAATPEPSEISLKSFENAEKLTNATLDIVLQRIGDPNVLPFIHISLAFMYYMSRYPQGMRMLEGNFPWQSLIVMLNTLLSPYTTPERIENAEFPLPIKDDVRPFTEDFALRGILWADGYYPENWFSNDKIDDEEKYLEVASMTDDRKERILWLACRIADSSPCLQYDKLQNQFLPMKVEESLHLESRSSTFASATSIDRAETWPPSQFDNDDGSDDEEKMRLPPSKTL